MNIVILSGCLGKDPEVIELQSGTTKTKMSLATNSGKDKDGNERAPDWHNLVAFGKTGETMGKHLKKGRRIGVQGRLQTRTWDKDGEKRWITEVIVDRFEFQSPKNGNGANGHADEAAEATGGVVTSSVEEDLADVPF